MCSRPRAAIRTGSNAHVERRARDAPALVSSTPLQLMAADIDQREKSIENTSIAGVP
jgi:hypothetical protein